MNLITDRDLVLYEPNLFQNVSFLGQTIVNKYSCSFNGSQLTANSLNFNDYQLDVMNVVTINEFTFEVLNVVNTTKLKLSLIRTNTDDSQITSHSIADARFSLRTFLPQIKLIQDAVFLKFGINKDEQESWLEEKTDVLKEKIKKLVILGTLERIFSAASIVIETKFNDFREKTSYYQDLFNELLEQIKKELTPSKVDDEYAMTVINLVR